MPYPWITDVSNSIPFDGSVSELSSDNVQDAIDELKQLIDDIQAGILPHFVIRGKVDCSGKPLDCGDPGLILTNYGGFVLVEN